MYPRVAGESVDCHHEYIPLEIKEIHANELHGPANVRLLYRLARLAGGELLAYSAAADQFGYVVGHARPEEELTRKLLGLADALVRDV